MRLYPEGDPTGWYIWSGEELLEDPDFFVPLHVVHVDEWDSKIRKYLGLVPGWRFLITEDYEDVWFDEATLKARREEIQDQAADHNTYMVIHDNGSKMTVGLLVNRVGEVPEGMVSMTLPEEEYEVFRFEEKHICSFWQFFCEQDNQKKYGVDAAKARFEIFNDGLQPNGVTEICFPKE